MPIPRISFLLTLLSCYSILTIASFNTFNCARETIETWTVSPYIADCRAAIALIPDGTIKLDGITRKPLNFMLPSNAREPRILFPAHFRSGNCVIQVAPYLDSRNGVRGGNRVPKPQAAASMLYYKVLPAIRRIAQKAVDKCFPATATGYVRAIGWTENFQEEEGSLTFAYTFSIDGRVPRPLGAKPEWNMWLNVIHVYQADESGKLVRTTWPRSWQPPRG